MTANGEDLPYPYDPDGVGLDFDDVEDADARVNIELLGGGRQARTPSPTRTLDLSARRGQLSKRTRDLR